MSDVEFYFLVTANTDGTFSTYAEVPKDLESNRPANTYDMFSTMREVVQEMETSFLADRVAQRVASMLSPTEPSVADRVADALKERGIQPESTPASE